MKRHSFNSKRKFFICIVFTIFFISNISATQIVFSDPTDVFDLIMGRVRESSLNVNTQKLEKNVSEYFTNLSENGAFNDIDYSDRSQTNWTPVAHIDRLQDMATAYIKEDNRYYKDPELYKRIVNSLRFWYDIHPASTNWYWQQIGTPQRLGTILILMRAGEEKLSSDLEKKLITRIELEGNRPDQLGSFGTGANKMDIATHWIYRACLLKNPDMLRYAVDQAFYPLFLTTKEGLQYDYSYQQHGNQLYIGGYGYVIIEGITRLAVYLRDTPYAIPEEKKQYLSGFLLKSYLPVIRGQYYLYNVLGRGMTRTNSLNQSSFVTVLRRMLLLDTDNEKVYTAAIDRLTGNQQAGYSLQPFNTHFWNSDYTLHQRPNYTFDVRMASTYTCRNENGNGEGLNGYFLTDGATTIVRTGDEYYNIFPVWDWARIPGVTNPVKAEIPRPRAWQTYGTSNFAGGVSDGMYSVSAYALNDTAFDINTSAKKSWFVFEDEVVCLGAGISSSAKEVVNTTINQCLLKGDIVVQENNKVKNLGKNVNHTTNDLSWILQDGIGYYFPNKSSLTVMGGKQTGSWKSINTSLSDKLMAQEVFKLWFDHGSTPKNQQYVYYILPGKTISDMKLYAPNHLSVLENSEMKQVVLNHQLDILGIVFFQPGTFSGNNISITTDKPCVLMINGLKTDKPCVYIADPSRKESMINLGINLNNKGIISLACELPVHPNAFAGLTKKYELAGNNN